jgi:hypothetical protein
VPVAWARLTSQAVELIVKWRVAEADYNALRARFLTSAAVGVRPYLR